MDENRILKVRGDSNVHAVASKAATLLVERPRDGVHLRAIGASSVNQAAKAAAVVRGKVATHGYDLVTRIGFDRTKAENERETSVLVFRLDLR